MIKESIYIFQMKFKIKRINCPLFSGLPEKERQVHRMEYSVARQCPRKGRQSARQTPAESCPARTSLENWSVPNPPHPDTLRQSLA